jgi:carbamoyltransferase
MWILGLANSHNGAVALLEDGRVRSAIQLERLERAKRFPLKFQPERLGDGVERAIAYCLDAAGIAPDRLDGVAVSSPWRLPHAVHWPHAPLHWVPHHLAHAEYVLHYGEGRPGLVLVVDGHGTYHADRPGMQLQETIAADARVFPGDAETVSAYRFDGHRLELVYRTSGVHNPARGGLLDHSVGAAWELASLRCFGARDQAGKVMGLAGFGHGGAAEGLFSLDAEGRLITRLERLTGTGLPFRDIAAGVQAQTEALLVDLLRRLRPLAAGDALYYTGGVALNVLANRRILDAGIFDSLWMNGSCEDNGTAIGAALALHHALGNSRRQEAAREDYGIPYGRDQLLQSLLRVPVRFERLEVTECSRRAAALLAAGKVIGWFQGGGEFGPRALGHRSIFGHPGLEGVKARLNGRVKHRESFRPYAAMVTEAAAARFFDLPCASPMMLLSARVLDPRLSEVNHVDGSCRIQTVTAEREPLLDALLQAFEEASGLPVLLNTSLNVAGQPIVETPDDALLTLLRSELDALVLGDYLVTAT